MGRSAYYPRPETSSRRTTLDDRAFPVAAARAWNSLPPQTRTNSSLTIFRREVKTRLFCQSYGWQKYITPFSPCGELYLNTSF